MREHRTCDSRTHFQGGELYLFSAPTRYTVSPSPCWCGPIPHSCAAVYLLGTAIVKYARPLVTGGVACQGYTLSPLKPGIVV